MLYYIRSELLCFINERQRSTWTGWVAHTEGSHGSLELLVPRQGLAVLPSIHWGRVGAGS